MASDAAVALMQAYQRDQRQIAGGLLRDLLGLWRTLIRPGEFDLAALIVLAEAAAVLVERRREESAQAAVRLYERLRAVSGAEGTPAVAEPQPLEIPRAVGLLRGAGMAGFIRARRAGMPERQALDAARVRVAGSATNLALGGGRQTVMQVVSSDDRALGWMRVTSGAPCHFCLTLASRGPVYKSQRTADFEAHDHCSCAAVPVFRGTPIPDSVRRAEEVYRAAQDWARRHPDLAAHGTSNDALNNVRRYLEHRGSEARDAAA